MGHLFIALAIICQVDNRAPEVQQAAQRECMAELVECVDTATKETIAKCLRKKKK